MQIELSPKHEPLFKLLEAWNTCFNQSFYNLNPKDRSEVLNSTELPTEYLNESFLELDKEEQQEWLELSRVDTILEYGGRDSGKSFSTSLWTPLAVADYGHRILYTRYVMNTTDHSISSALDERIGLLGKESAFKYANNTYTHENGGKIFITGQKTSSLNQTAKLKSLEDFTVFITDEGDEVKTFDEWNKIKRSMRGDGLQNLSMIIFNPPTKEHWIYEEFFEDRGVEAGFSGIHENVLYIHTTYLDNLDHVQPHNLLEYTRLKDCYDQYMDSSKAQRELLPNKIVKGYRKYKNEVLGGFRDVADGVIYEDWEKGEFDTSLPYAYGLDFGFDDPDALCKVAVDERKKLIYVEEKLYQNGLGTEQLADKVIENCGREDMVIGDAADPRLIRDLYYYGVNIKKAKKGQGSVLRTIKKIQDYTIVVCGNSPNIMKHLNNYVWNDKRAGVPKNDFKHFPDAIGYAFIFLTR